jgi:Ca2+-binding RTX toxin-like protein
MFAIGLVEPLKIDGTPDADSIVVARDGEFLNITKNGVTTSHRWKTRTIPGSTPGSQIILKGISKLVIKGFAGNDLLDASQSPVPVEAFGGEGRDTIKGGAAEDFLMGPEERINGNTNHISENTGDVIYGGGAGDHLIAAVNGVNSSLYGDSGKDTITGSEMADYIEGGRGDDLINSRKGNDTIKAGYELSNIMESDNDHVDSGDGLDSVWGGAGSDMLITAAGSDLVYGGAGNDTISTNHGFDTVYAGLGNDKVSTGDHDDYIAGEAGNDTLDGNNGNDSIYGGDGDDSVTGGAGRDNIHGNAGFDEVNYKDHFQPVVVRLTGASNNGQSGENDTVGVSFEAIRGGSGADTLIGNGVANRIWGESGDDVIRAGDGNDTVDAGFGDDSVWGEGGADSLDGYLGDDELFAGGGDDTVIGHYGQDRLITLGGGKDKAVGGVGHDIYVADTSDDTADYRNNVAEKDALHKIGSFSNGASLEPTGQNLTDPSLTGFSNATYGMRFANIPLFPRNGDASKDDVIQGSIGDCYFMAGISGIAGSPKWGIIEKNVVDLGDGSYMVKFFDDSTPKWYRVDNQLPIKKGTTSELTFARMRGGADATMWAPILEKAWAFHRTGDAKYQEIVGDNDWTDPGMPYEAFAAFGLWHDTDEVIFNAKEDYMAKMRNFLLAGGSVTASTDPPFLGCDLTAFHVYTVEKVSADLKYVTIRNPWARDDDGFKQGPDDGRMTIHVNQFDDDFFFISYSNL